MPQRPSKNMILKSPQIKISVTVTGAFHWPLLQTELREHWLLHGRFRALLKKWEPFKLSWLPYLILMRKLELFMPWWLENRGAATRYCRFLSVMRYALGRGKVGLGLGLGAMRLACLSSSPKTYKIRGQEASQLQPSLSFQKSLIEEYSLNHNWRPYNMI